ncbi:hypothetical protein HHI36_009780 [Cryptolaemus montrouzieri]|uniref:Uncharacterized protein n=1 Tax=Cryptolaemus montrouzieri TaxID=559131 RepID=A0ABD2MGV1_9CUCU
MNGNHQKVKCSDIFSKPSLLIHEQEDTLGTNDNVGEIQEGDIDVAATNSMNSSDDFVLVQGKAPLGQDGFGGPKRIAWLLVSRADNSSKVESLQRHLAKFFSNNTFDISEIRKHDKNTSPNEAYKIRFDYNILHEVLNPEIWPVNIIVKKYLSFRHKIEDINH